MTDTKIKKQLPLIIGLALVIVLLAAVAVYSAAKNQKKAAENEKLAQDVFSQLIEKTFSGSTETDDGFSSDSMKGSLNPYQYYWKTTETYTYTFHEDGTASSIYQINKIILAYPKNSSEPEDINTGGEPTQVPFSIQIDSDGTAYLKLGYNKYKITLDESNAPLSLSNDEKGLVLEPKSSSDAASASR